MWSKENKTQNPSHIRTKQIEDPKDLQGRLPEQNIFQNIDMNMKIVKNVEKVKNDHALNRDKLAIDHLTIKRFKRLVKRTISRTLGVFHREAVNALLFKAIRFSKDPLDRPFSSLVSCIINLETNVNSYAPGTKLFLGRIIARWINSKLMKNERIKRKVNKLDFLTYFGDFYDESDESEESDDEDILDQKENKEEENKEEEKNGENIEEDKQEENKEDEMEIEDNEMEIEEEMIEEEIESEEESYTEEEFQEMKNCELFSNLHFKDLLKAETPLFWEKNKENLDTMVIINFDSEEALSPDLSIDKDVGSSLIDL